MWALQVHSKELYIAIFFAAVFLVFSGLGPGLFSNTDAGFNDWQYLIFDVLCHQDPARSYSISGIPMAVCSRCLGIYSFFLAGWLSMPAYAVFSGKSQKTEKKWLIAAILLNLADVFGNTFGIWTNTLATRFMLGGFAGLPLAFILANEFFTLNKTE